MRGMHVLLMTLLVLMPVGFMACQHPQAQVPTTPVANVPASPGSGADLFARNCAMCHGQTGGGSPMVPADVRFNNPLWQKTLTDQQIADTIKNGSGPMPSFSGKLNDKEIQTLVKYIRTLPDTAKAPAS